MLPITVDNKGDNFIEVVTQKVKAGYLNGYADQECIESLQQISLLFLGSGKQRGFPLEGDSIPLHADGSIIVGRYIEKLGDVNDGKTYILITKNEFMVYKRLNKNKKNVLFVESDNSFYPVYEVKVSDILEFWEYVCNIGLTDKKQKLTETASVTKMFLELKKSINDLKIKR